MSRRRPSSTHQDHDLNGEGAIAWALNHHRRSLIYRVLPDEKEALGGDVRRRSGYRISLAELQRMRLRVLQIQLVDDVVQLCGGGGGSTDGPGPKEVRVPQWEEHLEAYTKAIQDYEYMKQSSRQSRDPFLITAERSVDNFILSSLVQRPHVAAQDVISSEPWEPEKASTPISGTRHETNKETARMAFVERLAIAVVAGLFLVGPMWLMVLHNTMWTSLVTTSLLVFVFGFMAAYYVEDKEKVLASTAAYAAVLVVFVGLSAESG